jgi:hypothetical protein
MEDSIAPKQQSRRGQVSEPLDDRPAGDETIDDYDHRHYEQQMDQRASDVESQEPKNPQDEENYRDGPKH